MIEFILVVGLFVVGVIAYYVWVNIHFSRKNKELGFVGDDKNLPGEIPLEIKEERIPFYDLEGVENGDVYRIPKNLREMGIARKIADQLLKNDLVKFEYVEQKDGLVSTFWKIRVVKLDNTEDGR